MVERRAAQRWVSWSLLAAFGAVGCAGRPTPAVHAPVPPPAAAPAGHAKKPRAAAPCVVRHRGRCFGSPDAACAFAGCPDQRCEVYGEHPAHVACDDMR